MTRSEFTSIFNAFEKMHILIVGDVMVDSYLWGDVNRISPEAPVPIIATTGRENRLGGAANVALNIHSLGAVPVMCSVIGSDKAGGIFKDLMKDIGLTTDGIIASDKRKTTIKTRIISHNHHLLRVDEEETTPIAADLQERLKVHLKSLLDTYTIDAVIFEDYDKGTLTPEVIAYAVEQANAKGIPTLVDPKKRHFHDYKNVTFFKPNFKEFKEGLKLDISSSDKAGIVAAAQSFIKDQGIGHFMVTMAEKGVMITDTTTPHFIPAEVRSIADVSGAGDTLISVSSLCLAAGMQPRMVAAVANMAGGLVCEHSGVVPIDKQELLDECLMKLVD